MLLATSFWHARGGDTTAAFAGARALTDAGAEVIPFAMRHPENAPSAWETTFAPHRDTLGARGLPRLRQAIGALWSRSAAHAARRMVERARPDVVWLHHVHRHLTPSVITAFTDAGVPVVWTLHDYELVCATGLAWRDGAPCHRCAGHAWHHAVLGRCKRGDVAQSAWVATEKWVHGKTHAVDRVSAFLCPSQYLADRMIDGGLRADRVHHLPNVVEDPGAAEGPGEGWLVAGRISTEKGLDVALACGVPGLTLVGPGAPAVLPAGARATGPLSHADTLAAIGAAAVVAVPSRWPENAPYAVLEAQVRGRVVVASAVGGIPELIEDGVDGVLVPPGDPGALGRAVRALLDDPERRAEMGARARARVLAVHAPDRLAAALSAHFSAAIRGGPGAGAAGGGT